MQIVSIIDLIKDAENIWFRTLSQCLLKRVSLFSYFLFLIPKFW